MREYKEVRSRFGGDIDTAKSYLGHARVLLGKLKKDVNDLRIDQLSRMYYLPDGSFIRVRTAFGQDYIDIYAETMAEAPSMEAQAPIETSAEPIETSAKAIETSAEPIETSAKAVETSAEPIEHKDDYKAPVEPSAPKFHHEEIEQKLPQEKKKDEFEPYLWVGARIIEGGRRNNGELVVKLHLCVWDSVGSTPDIISNRSHLLPITTPFSLLSADTSVYPLQDPEFFFPPGDKTGIGYTKNGLLQLSTDNPLGIVMHAPDDATTIWDEIIVADPEDDLKTGIRSKDPVGLFVVKVMAQGPDCYVVSPTKIEVKIIAGKGKHRSVNTHITTIETCTRYNYGMLPYGWFEPFNQYGTINGNECNDCHVPANDEGANPHGSHWWQGAGFANIIRRGSAELPLKEYNSASFSAEGSVFIPKTGFITGEFASIEDRCPACVRTYFSRYIASSRSETFTLMWDWAQRFTEPNGPTGEGVDYVREVWGRGIDLRVAGGSIVLDTSPPGDPNFTFDDGTVVPKANATYTNFEGDIHPWVAIGTVIAEIPEQFYWSFFFSTGWTYSDIWYCDGAHFPCVSASETIGFDRTHSFEFNGGAFLVYTTTRDSGPTPGTSTPTIILDKTVVYSYPTNLVNTETCRKILYINDT